MEITKAKLLDLEKILELQKTAYISEAQIHNNFEIQPLKQTFEELVQEFYKSVILKAVDGETGKIIGSVRAYSDRGTAFIGKLMVHPDYQNKGIGKTLLKEIEVYFPGMRLELFTSTKSDKNLSLYIKSGYKEFRRESMPDGVDFVYLEKI